ncbi:MAG: GDSL-type esterase/lipase family protein [Campylobacterota bacterium]|nr:GDSL-type esterase/lipase family protein [Campylobacterota bacterium]
MYKYLVVLLIAILALIFFNKERSYVSKLDDSDTILAFGDSITYGFGARYEESYPYLLAQSTGRKVINAGVNGDTSSEGLERIHVLLEDESIELIILCFGGNDILQKNSNETIKSNIREMIQIAKAKDIDVVLISVPDVSLLGLNPLEIYDELADEEDVELIEGLLSHVLSRSSLKNDYIHPNNLGYKYMAEEIHEHLKSKRWIQ